jgi:hypothetical protein
LSTSFHSDLIYNCGRQIDTEGKSRHVTIDVIILDPRLDNPIKHYHDYKRAPRPITAGADPATARASNSSNNPPPPATVSAGSSTNLQPLGMVPPQQQHELHATSDNSRNLWGRQKLTGTGGWTDQPSSTCGGIVWWQRKPLSTGGHAPQPQNLSVTDSSTAKQQIFSVVNSRVLRQHQLHGTSIGGLQWQPQIPGHRLSSGECE